MSEDFARSIKPLPWVASQILRDFDKSTLGVDRLAQAIETDPVLTGQVLKVANSSYYAVPGGVQEVRRALRYLGFEVVRQIALSVSILGLFSSKELEKRFRDLPRDQEIHLRSLFSLVEFWKKSLTVAKILEMDQGKDAFSVGLVHAVGKWVVLDQVLDRKPSQSLISRTWEELESELAELEPSQEWSYAEWSAFIAQHWGFHKDDVEMIRTQQINGPLHESLQKFQTGEKKAAMDFAEACLGSFDL